MIVSNVSLPHTLASGTLELVPSIEIDIVKLTCGLFSITASILVERFSLK